MDVQLNGVADQRVADEDEQACQHQQSDADRFQNVVHAFHLVLGVGHVDHLAVQLQRAGNLLQRVGVGIVGDHLHRQFRRKRVAAGKLAGVHSHVLLGQGQGAVATDVAHLAGIGQGLDGASQGGAVDRRDGVGQNDTNLNVFTQATLQVAGREHREHHKAKQHQHHCGTDAQCHQLQAVPALAVFSSLHCRKGVNPQCRCKVTIKRGNSKIFSLCLTDCAKKWRQKAAVSRIFRIFAH